MRKQSKPNSRVLQPVTTAEARQEQMIMLAYDLVQQRLLDGTATSQETTHFLKLASAKERLDLEKAKVEIELAKAKIKTLEEEQNRAQVYEEALKAFRSYQGDDDEEDIF